MSQAIDHFVKQNEERFLEELKEFIRVPSISTLPAHEAEALRRETDLARHLGTPRILMGLRLPDEGLHSPNEKFKVDNLYLGIRTIVGFLEKYGPTGSFAE